MSIYTPWSSDGDTPAPWMVEDTDERTVVLDACGGLIADCTNGFHDDDGQWVMSAACGPLARLLAAAPKLLAACEAVEHAQRTGNYGDAFEAVRAAVAEAVAAS